VEEWQKRLFDSLRQAGADQTRADEEVGSADWSNPQEVERQVKRLIVDSAATSVSQGPLLLASVTSANLLGAIQRDVARIRRCAVGLLVVAVLALLVAVLALLVGVLL
jgi:hypothetical protein